MALNGNSAIAVINDGLTVSITYPKSLWDWVSDIRKEVCILGAYGLTVGSVSCSLVGAGIGVMPVVAVAPVVLVGAGVAPSASADAGASASAATRADEAMHTFKFFMWLLRKFLCTRRVIRYTKIFSAFLSDMDYLVSP